MKVKTKTACDYANDSINYMNTYEPYKTIKYQVLKSRRLLFGLGKYQGWRLDYTEEGIGAAGTSYIIDICSVIDDNLLKLSFECPDPLLVPTYLPDFQKMINSFQINGS